MKSDINKNLLYDYVNGLLPDKERAEFEKQLAQSVDLQSDLKRVKQYYSLVKSSEPSEVPRDFIEKVHRKIGILNELPNESLSPVHRAAVSAPLMSRSNEQKPGNLQEEKKKNSPFKLGFKHRFPFEIAGVMATVAILVFIFIPNVNTPEISRKMVYDESALQEYEENKSTDDTQMSLEKEKTASEISVPKPVVSVDKKATGNEGVSVKNKEMKNEVPERAIVKSSVKGMIADDHAKLEAPAPAAPVPSATPSMSESRVAPVTKEINKRAVPATEMTAVEGLTADVVAMSSTLSEEKQSSEPVRIIMRGASSSNPELSTAPSSMQPEGKKMRTRRAERSMLKSSKTEISEAENIAGKPSGAATGNLVSVNKTEIEALFSECDITWKLLSIEESRLLYRLNGSEQEVKLLVDKLKSAGFIQINMPVLSNDSVNVELEINY